MVLPAAATTERPEFFFWLDFGMSLQKSNFIR